MTVVIDSVRPSTLLERYQRIRKFSVNLASPLTPEDCAIQSMSDASPTRWHLAHTTWFFETFFLKRREGFLPYNPRFEQLFNSYYNAVGSPFPRNRRGQLSRPGLAEILTYRSAIDDAICDELTSHDLSPEEQFVVELGLQHEQQHQELILTDIKHAFFSNPLYPVYHAETVSESTESAMLATDTELNWHHQQAGVKTVGDREDGFAYDNERPAHQTFIQSHEIADRCVTNAEYLGFIDDGGYTKPDWWLSDGWAKVQEERWSAPLYWIQQGGQWQVFTLEGLSPLRLDEPVCHVSYFEADAYARWAGYRLPTEFEWEVRATSESSTGESKSSAFADRLLNRNRPVHPVPEQGMKPGRKGMLGNVWEWTSSQYLPYPGFRSAPGALGEYNGKFMCNQFVLRGGSCATSSDHIRLTYRNFFPPETRWQFSGIRLARDERR